MKLLRFTLLTLLLFSLVLAGGCGTLSSTKQEISFSSDVPAVRVQAGGQMCVTPCVLSVPTSGRNLQVVAEKEGYAHQSQNLSSGMNPLVLGGNLVLGGLYLSPFFTTTDHSNGSLYKYSPNSFHFTMGAPNGQVSRTVAPAPAPVAAPVATPSSRGNDGNIPGLERAVEEAAHRVLANVRGRPRIAIVDINAMPRSVEDVITGELEDIWVNQGYTVVDRSQLDRLRAEQRLQHGGEVDERKAVSIGKLSGANIIIIGSLDGTGDQRRFRLRAIDVQTAEVVGSAIERLAPRQ